MKDHLEELSIFFKRKSIRNYTDTPVENEKIIAILEAARWAPSTQNKQPWEFIVIDDPQMKKETIDNTGFNFNKGFLHKAPILIIGLADKRKNTRFNGMDYFLVDFAIAMEHLVLAASELGLGTCWLAWFSESPLRKFLKIPKHLRIVALTPLGYPKDELTFIDIISKSFVKSKKRKALEDLTHYNGYGKQFKMSL